MVGEFALRANQDLFPTAGLWQQVPDVAIGNAKIGVVVDWRIVS